MIRHVIGPLLFAMSLILPATRTTLGSGPNPQTQPSGDSAAWYVLKQPDIDGLLLGLPERLGRLAASTKGSEGVWKGVPGGAKLTLDVAVEGDAKGEILVGFFADPRWYLDDPVQVRRLSGPGRFVIDGLPAGSFVIGASMGAGCPPAALGVHRDWPSPITVKPGSPAEARLLLSPDFRNRPAGQPSSMLEGFAGRAGKLNPERLVTVRTVEPDGRALPFCRVTFAERQKADPSKVHMFHESGSDVEGKAFCDAFSGPFSLMVQRFDFVPGTMLSRFYFRKIAEVHDSRQDRQVTVQMPAFPTGTGTLAGRAMDQHGRPLRQYTLSFQQEKGESLDMGEYSSIQYKLPVINPEGRFELSRLPPGQYTAQVRAFDYATHAWGPKMASFTIPESNAVTKLDITVEAKELFYGRLVYADASPVTKGLYKVRFADTESKYYADRVAADGTFRVCLSKQEREDLTRNQQGMVEVSDRLGNVGEVRFDKLSRDAARPATVVLASQTSHPATVPASRPGTQ